MNFSNLFKMDYWFSQPYSAYGFTFWAFVIFFLVLILLGIVLYILLSSKKDRTGRLVMKRTGNFGMTMGLLGLLWMFFRQESVVFLAWRFWLLLWVLMAVWWLARILEYIVKRIPQIKKEKEARHKMQKYLPN